MSRPAFNSDLQRTADLKAATTRTAELAAKQARAVVLFADTDLTNVAIAQRLGVGVDTVGDWRRRLARANR